MILKKFKFDLNKLKKASYIQILVIALLCLTNLLTVIQLSANKTVVTQSLSPFCQESSFGSDFMSENAHRTLGFTLANIIGNVNPKNTDFVRNAVLSYAHSTVYTQVNNILSDQLAEIQKDDVILSFMPDNTIYEEGKVFVSGKFETSGLTGKKKMTIRTYEFVFNVSNYAPSFTYMTTYDGEPKTNRWKLRHGKMETN